MIETARLLLKPLTFSQLVKYLKCDNSLENELNLNPTSRTISPELKEALEQTILPNAADTSKNYLFSTLWTIILISEQTMVGDLCFYGEPNPEGEIEIGYGTYPEFENRGLMTEALGGIISWAQTQPNVIAIMASTEKVNEPSHKVLLKNNFTRAGETGTMFRWKRVLDK